MELIFKIFGEGRDLDSLQMSARGAVLFVIALILIRISGRRSFGVRAPLDNIIAMLLGAVMSRAIVGASPFIPVVVSSFVIVLLHRLFGWLIARNKSFSHLVEGEKILLFDKGKFLDSRMRRALVSKGDIMQGVRKSALTEDMDEIEQVYMERNGDISAIKKKS